MKHRRGVHPQVLWQTMVRTAVHTLSLGGLLLTVLLGHLRYNTTPSAPLGWYWYTPLGRDVSLRRGQLVLMTPPAWVRQELRRVAPHLDEARPWMKTIMAIAGDTVCLEGDQVTINGEERGHRPLLHDYPLRLVYGCVTLPAETYFVMNAHPRSFDSRYVGPIPRVLIHGTCTPILTWEVS